MLTLFTAGDFVTKPDFTLSIHGEREYNLTIFDLWIRYKFISRSCARARVAVTQFACLHVAVERLPRVNVVNADRHWVEVEEEKRENV